jgi:hypothetical protein
VRRRRHLQPGTARAKLVDLEREGQIFGNSEILSGFGLCTASASTQVGHRGDLHSARLRHVIWIARMVTDAGWKGMLIEYAHFREAVFNLRISSSTSQASIGRRLHAWCEVYLEQTICQDVNEHRYHQS